MVIKGKGGEWVHYEFGVNTYTLLLLLLSRFRRV